MKGLRIGASALLVGFAVFIWLHDRAWMSSVSDSLPLLVVLPLAAWLGHPWRWRPQLQAPAPAWIFLTVCLTLVGAASGSVFLLALAWNAMAWLWMICCIEPRPDRPRGRLLVLGMMAFPWLVLEEQGIGNVFRLSGAWAASGFFELMGFSVTRQGTLFSIEGLPVSVDAACAGLNVLQAMLIVGVAFAALTLRSRVRFGMALVLLPLFAWMANTVRIIATGMTAVTFGPALARGQLHVWGGWMALCLMFVICLMILPLLESISVVKKKDEIAWKP